MVLLTVNVPEELRERLKLESNQSQVVSELLAEHFREESELDLNNKLFRMK